MQTGERRVGFWTRYLVWALVAGIGIIITLYGMWVYLNWTILQTVYQAKAGIDWFGTVFYRNNTFIVAGLLAFLTLNPRLGKSNLWGALNAISQAMARARSQWYDSAPMPTVDVRLGTRYTMWALWQAVKWSLAFLVIIALNGFPFLGNLTIPVTMLSMGLGSWSLLGRVITLPFSPATGSELVSLMPTLEVQYRILSHILGAVLIVLLVRFFLRLVRDFALVQRNAWLRDLFGLLASILALIILGAPYWAMDVTTPFDYAIAWTVFGIFLGGVVFFHFDLLKRTLSLSKRRRWLVMMAGVALLLVLLVNVGIVAALRLNWNNNWLSYEYQPLTQKQIEVTRWAAGVQNITRLQTVDISQGSPGTILPLVRQWDAEASLTRMKNQIGFNWMRLSDSNIIHSNVTGREYWIAPTTINYLQTDWISEHLIYTRAARILVIDSHTGDNATLSEVFGIPREPLIYYGEQFPFNVYVNVKGFSEIEEPLLGAYEGEPDYVLSGWQRSLWFLADGQLGFAFSPPQEEIQMLFNRDVLSRVSTILISGLNVDRDTYLVSDGSRVFYAVQVYASYPLRSEFALSPYMRFFGVVLVDIENGEMQGYTVSQPGPDDFILDFYQNYYPAWGPAPAWLVPQLRYSEELLGRHDIAGQLDMDFMVHVTDPIVWRSGSQFYERPIITTTTTTGTQVESPELTEVFFVLMEIGGESEFVGLQLVEFKQAPGKNLSGLYVALGGERLGETILYQIRGDETFVGPSAALQAFDAEQSVKSQLQLLPNHRFGNILLYSVGGELVYFIPVYQTEQVITKMSFIGAVDARTGKNVGFGPDSISAFNAMRSTQLPTKTPEERLSQIYDEFRQRGFTTISNWTEVNGDKELQKSTATYIDESQWVPANATIQAFIDFLISDKLYTGPNIDSWGAATSDTVNLGVRLPEGPDRVLYYISIRYR
jgi:hypothetical protein